MIVKRKILFTVVTLIATCIINYAQAPNSNWIPVIELSNQSVFIDTLTIKSVENQISVLSLTTYKKPQIIPSIGKEVSTVKSQVLFNIPIHKYSVIGTLYYDKNLKILGETSVPGFAANSQDYTNSVDSNSVMTAILNKCTSFLKKDVKVLSSDKNSKPETKNNLGPNLNDKKESLKANHEKIDSKMPVIKTTSNPAPADINHKPVEQITSGKVPLVKKDQSIKILNESPVKKEAPEILPSEIKKGEQSKAVQVSKVKEPFLEGNYNSKNESSPKNTIFTDGTKYCFQVSSWKNRTMAENEMKKLTKQYPYVFITQGIVKGKTWYRVRIGFFSSLEETEAYMKKQN